MRIMIVRIGTAFGDSIICTPLIKYLKEQGNEIYFLGGEGAQIVLKNNPYIDKFIYYKENTVPIGELSEFIKVTATAHECDKIVDLTGSLENSLLRHPNQPEYNDTKKQRIATCDKNVYDFCAEFAGYPELKGKLGELYFDTEEELGIKQYIENLRGKDNFIILWGLAGSGGNKSWPYYAEVWNDIILKYKNVIIISVGDTVSKILEVALEHKRFIPMSGKWKMMQSMAATKYVDLVVSPDTGLFHACGCFDTPKICILGHGTINHISKNFKNDYSLESDHDLAPCSPCFKLIYNSEIQCPYDEITGAPVCMSLGQSRERVRDHVFSIIDKYNVEKTCRK